MNKISTKYEFMNCVTKFIQQWDVHPCLYLNKISRARWHPYPMGLLPFSHHPPPPSSRPLAAEVLIHIELIYCHFVHLESYLGSTRWICRIYSHGRVLLYIYLGHLLFIRGSLKRYQRCCWCWCLHKTGKMWSPWALGHLSIFGNIEGKEGQWNKSDFCETQ